MNIKFYNEDNKYGIISDNIKIEFSNPYIQAHDEYGYCKNEKGILYYYYAIKAMAKNKNKRFESVFTASPFDFPQLLAFKNILDYFISDKNAIENYQKDDYKENGVWYNYLLDVGTFSEDWYSVEHIFVLDNEEKIKDFYNVTIGKPLDIDCSEVISVKLNNLTKNDLETIYKCIDGFVAYSIYKTNQIITKRNKKYLSSWKIIDNKLYQMSKCGKFVDYVYAVKDKIDTAKVLRGDINSKDFYSVDYSKFTIDAIENDYIVLSSGYEKDNYGNSRKINVPEKIYINTLLDLFNDVSEDMLRFNEKEIGNDFMNILSIDEKEEFKTKNLDFLFNKWSEAILNRTWMCREEHILPQRVKDEGNHENVYASIKVIIDKIKKDLQG